MSEYYTKRDEPLSDNKSEILRIKLKKIIEDANTLLNVETYYPHTLKTVRNAQNNLENAISNLDIDIVSKKIETTQDESVRQAYTDLMKKEAKKKIAGKKEIERKTLLMKNLLIKGNYKEAAKIEKKLRDTYQSFGEGDAVDETGKFLIVSEAQEGLKEHDKIYGDPTEAIPYFILNELEADLDKQEADNIAEFADKLEEDGKISPNRRVKSASRAVSRSNKSSGPGLADANASKIGPANPAASSSRRRGGGKSKSKKRRSRSKSKKRSRSRSKSNSKSRKRRRSRSKSKSKKMNKKSKK